MKHHAEDRPDASDANTEPRNDARLRLALTEAEAHVSAMETVVAKIDALDASTAAAIARARAEAARLGIKVSVPTAKPRPATPPDGMVPLYIAEESIRAAVSATPKAYDPEEQIDQNHSPFGSRKHRRLVREGKLPGTAVGKQVFVRRADLDAYLRSNPVEARKVERAHRDDEPTDDVDAELRRLGLR